jgi:hypothetical protein
VLVCFLTFFFLFLFLFCVFAFCVDPPLLGPTSPTMSDVSIDRLARERRSSNASEDFQGFDGNRTPTNTTPTNEDPDPIYSTFLRSQTVGRGDGGGGGGGGGRPVDVLARARAELEAIKREEQAVLDQLLAAQGMGRRQYATLLVVVKLEYWFLKHVLKHGMLAVLLRLLAVTCLCLIFVGKKGVYCHLHAAHSARAPQHQHQHQHQHNH